MVSSSHSFVHANVIYAADNHIGILSSEKSTYRAVSRVVSVNLFCSIFIVLLRRDSYVAMSLGYKQIITRALGMYSGILVLHWWLSPCASVMLYIYIHPRAHVITSYNI